MRKKTGKMGKRNTRSKSFFVNRKLKEDPKFKSFEEEVEQKHKKMQKKRKFCGTMPLQRKGGKYEVEHVQLKSVSIFDIITCLFEIDY